MRHIVRLSCLSAIIMLLLAGMASIQSIYADIITVTNTNDSGPGSLRQALANANNGDIIDFAVTGTITLTTGALLVSANVTIDGPGADQLAVNGNGSSRIFEIFSFRIVTISGLTVMNGFTDSDGGAIYNDRTTLTINSCTLSGNAAQRGGGVYISGGSGDAMVSFNQCTLSGNGAVDGGGIYNDVTGFFGVGTVAISNSTFSDNFAVEHGGAIYNKAGAQAGAVASLNNSTVSANSAADGGGIYSEGFFANIFFGNTVFNTGASGVNISNNGGMVASLGYNLSNDDGNGYLNEPGDQINSDPALGPLQDNGGPTFTHALLPCSPAIDTGDPNFTPPPDYDQRGLGFPRVVNGRIDIGAFEVQAPVPIEADLLTGIGVDRTTVRQGDLLTYTITVRNFGPCTAMNAIVNDVLSSGTTFVSASANRGHFTAPPSGQTGTVTWYVGDILNNGQESTQIVVTVLVRGRATITNTASVSSNTADPNTGNNSASITVSVAQGGGGGGGGGGHGRGNGG